LVTNNTYNHPSKLNDQNRKLLKTRYELILGYFHDVNKLRKKGCAANQKSINVGTINKSFAIIALHRTTINDSNFSGNIT
jgi:hypothetical protein